MVFDVLLAIALLVGGFLLFGRIRGAESRRREADERAIEMERELERCRSLIREIQADLQRRTENNHTGRALESLTDEVGQLRNKIEILSSGNAGSEESRNRPLLDTPAFQEIVGQLEQGASPETIAREKGLQVGEIALIRGLKQFMIKDES